VFENKTKKKKHQKTSKKKKKLRNNQKSKQTKINMVLIENPAMSSNSQAAGSNPGDYIVSSPYSYGNQGAAWKLFNKKWNQEGADPSGSNSEGFGDAGEFSENLAANFSDSSGTMISEGEFKDVLLTYPYTQYSLPHEVCLKDLVCYYSFVQGEGEYQWGGDPGRQVTNLLVVGKNPQDTKWTILHQVTSSTKYDVSDFKFPDGHPITWDPPTPASPVVWNSETKHEQEGKNHYCTGTMEGFLAENTRAFSQYRFLYTKVKWAYSYAMNEIVLKYSLPEQETIANQEQETSSGTNQETDPGTNQETDRETLNKNTDSTPVVTFLIIIIGCLFLWLLYKYR